MALVTILIPNYRTPEITRLCLRLIRQLTDPELIRVIAIDNDSGDDSTAYLRTLRWIQLIERKAEADDTPELSHARALDMGVTNVDTPYFVSFHTDTFVRRNDWLPFLLSHIESKPEIAGVGSWKLEYKPRYRYLAKKFEARVQNAWYGLIAKDRGDLEHTPHHRQYLRSHCALYRTDAVQRNNLCFSENRDTVGRHVYDRLIELGYQMKFLSSPDLLPYVVHINHATKILNPELGSQPRAISQGQRRIREVLVEINADDVLANHSLDN